MEVEPDPTPSAAELEALAAMLSRPGDARALRDGLQRARAIRSWQSAPEVRIRVVRALIRRGLARDALELLPPLGSEPDPALEQLRAWAYASTGATVAAARVLERLIAAGHDDVETLGLLGRTAKDQARRADSVEAAAKHWRRALALYRTAYDRTGDSYPGINAAALALRLGERTVAGEIAEAVRQTVDAVIAEGSGDEWSLATRAEALLVLGAFDAARQDYAAATAAVAALGDWNALGSTVRQARELLADHGKPKTFLDDAFALPGIAVFSGHRLDAKDRSETRFDPDCEDAVSCGIARALDEQGVQIGFSAAADGADILFLEALLARGGEAHIVLPTEVEQFLDESVSAEGWVARCRAVLDRASSITICSEAIDPEDPSAYDFANRVTLGFAQLSARELGAPLTAIAVWDGEAGLPGGTGDCVELWLSQELKVLRIDPPRGVAAALPPRQPKERRYKRTLRGLVFADIVGYSKLSEPDIERFYREVLPHIAALSGETGTPPILTQTFGDAFYFVFGRPREAANFALALSELFRTRLPEVTQLALRVRVALHAGPLLALDDPLTGQRNYTGRHSSKAARVEPVAPENQVLTTQQFAALLALENAGAYDLAYAGEQVLPKGYGTERLYLLGSATPGRSAGA